MSLLYDPAAPGMAKALLHDLGITPNRTLGQNFLINPGVLDHTVATAGVTKADNVLEIGPGLGALTCRLAARADRVTAIEKDDQFVALLRSQLPTVRLVQGDALKVEWATLGLPEVGVKVVANLPYSISKPMLRRLCEEWRPHVHSATVMVQREVADRLLAAPGAAAYGPMAIMAKLYGTASRAFHVSPGSFLPPPEVTSSVVQIEMLPESRVELDDERLFWRVVRAAFGQRRKQLGNVLQVIVPDKAELASVLNGQGIGPQRRGETLTLEEYARLSNHLSHRITQKDTEEIQDGGLRIED